jgi:hypothetical protein
MTNHSACAQSIYVSRDKNAEDGHTNHIFFFFLRKKYKDKSLTLKCQFVSMEV